MGLGDLLKRPHLSYQDLTSALEGRWAADVEQFEPSLQWQIDEQVEIRIKYQGYIDRQAIEIERHSYYEELELPRQLDYSDVSGLSNEVRQKLMTIKPNTIGQASRISGVTPAAISILLIHLKKSVARKSSPL